jgi:tetrahydromethanopterin S-methyltransferase subunit D
MNSHAILLCLVALVAFPALVFGAGTIFANTVITTTPIDTGVQFHDPLYARMPPNHLSLSLARSLALPLVALVAYLLLRVADSGDDND